MAPGAASRPLALRVTPIALVVLLELGCGTGALALDLRASAWPEADRLFHAEPRWLGGDAAFSVDLGAGRTLWLFGDSFIATSAARRRSEATMVRNCVAIQDGADPTTAKISFHWRARDGEPGSFFAEQGDAWFWPGHGVMLGEERKLLLFLSRVVKSGEGSFGFRAAGWEARLVAPDASPAAWRLRPVAAPKTRFVMVGGVSALVEGDHLLAFGVREPESHDVILMRWSVSRAAAGDLSQPEWWLGATRGWVAHAALGDDLPAVLFRGATEFSVHHDPALDRYVYVQTEGFGAASLVLRSAARPEGPWSAAQAAYRPPESDRGGRVIVYAGKAHPQLVTGSSGSLVATYASNSTDFGELVRDPSLYFPRFVRLTIGR